MDDISRSAFEVFFVQSPSFLARQSSMQQTQGVNNGNTLFGITRLPSDKHPTVKRWLAIHDRRKVHSMPTSASWLNQIEIWFNLVTQRAVRRGTFKSVNKLVAKIEAYVETYNQDARPFARTATADSILEKIKRLSQAISESGH